MDAAIASATHAALGERACPPEDCGGIHSFGEIVAGLAARTFDTELRAWLPRGFNPARFDPAAVRFSDLARRLEYSGVSMLRRGMTPAGLEGHSRVAQNYSALPVIDTKQQIAVTISTARPRRVEMELGD
jgi:hypothetical protein